MCLFCKIISKEIPSYKVYEDDEFYAFLDISQSTYGHTLVVPKKHMKNIIDADADTLNRILVIVQKISRRLMEQLNAQGINILSNANEISGQSVDHFHMHIIPRYSHDELEFVFSKHEPFDLEELSKRI